MLQPQSGKRCSTSAAAPARPSVTLEPAAAREPSAIVGIDIVVGRLREARGVRGPRAWRASTRGRRRRAICRSATAFRRGVRVAVLQHLDEPRAGAGGFARVTRPGGRLVRVEPDNASRYLVQRARRRYARRSTGDAVLCRQSTPRAAGDRPPIGPRLPAAVARDRLRAAVTSGCFPVTLTRVGAPGRADVAGAAGRRRHGCGRAPEASGVAISAATRAALERYAADARSPRAALRRDPDTRCSLPWWVSGPARSGRPRRHLALGRSNVSGSSPRRQPPKAGRAGTTTPRSTTGRTRGRSAVATSPFWRASRGSASAAAFSSSDAARAACSCRSRGPASRSSASIARRRCWRAAARRVRRLACSRRCGVLVRGDVRAAAAGHGALRSGHRALRHPAVAAARPRSRGDARHRSRASCAGRRLRHRPRARRAPTGANTAQRVTHARAARAAAARHHAGRVGPPGPRRRLTIFDQEFTEGRGRQARRSGFSLAFRTLPVERDAPASRARRLRDRRGSSAATDGGPWDPRADTWILVARKPPGPRPRGRL